MEELNYEACVTVECDSVEDGKQKLLDSLDYLAETMDLDETETPLIEMEHKDCGCCITLSEHTIPDESIYCIHGSAMILYKVQEREKDIKELMKRIKWKSFHAYFK